MEGCSKLARGVRWRDAGVADSQGCGSAMRVAPIGLYYTDLDQVAEVARASSLLTHGHPAALEAATAGALMVARALTGASPEQIFDEINARCRASADFTATWNKVPDFHCDTAGRFQRHRIAACVVSTLHCTQSPTGFSVKEPDPLTSIGQFYQSQVAGNPPTFSGNYPQPREH